MTPIRIGFVGLSKRGWGRTAHLPYLSKTSNYEIAALVNSSIESSKDAIKELGLSPDTKAYGSVAELAKDPSIDLIVVSVKAPDHYKTLKPAIEAGKNVFVEWPLGATLQQAEELAQLAKEKGIRSIVGAQGHLEPASRAVKKLIEGGSIGGVVSTEATLYPAGLSTTQAPQTNYLLSRESSGLLPLIYFPHCTL